MNGGVDLGADRLTLFSTSGNLFNRNRKQNFILSEATYFVNICFHAVR